MVEQVTEQRWLTPGAELPQAKKPVQNPGDALTSKETFLQLLVAQIRHQNPMEPQDGLQFVGQLAQFSGLEQTVEMRKELEAIHKILDVKAAAEPGAGSDESKTEEKKG